MIARSAPDQHIGRKESRLLRKISLRAAVCVLALAGSPLAAQEPVAPPAARPAEAPSAPHAQRLPNVVLIMADDMGVEAVNAYGGQYATPRIDALARQGMRFDNAHAMPLCTPSRARLMTGRENARSYEAFGYLAPNQPTFGQMMKGAGYATAIVGKWQLAGNGFDGRQGMMPPEAGFDHGMLWQVTADDSRGSRYWGPTNWVDGQMTPQEWGFGPDLRNRFATDFIRQNRERPFFLYYPMVLPHSPFVPTPDDLGAEGNQDRFAGMIEYVDKLVGNVLDELEKQGLADNTIVIFTGDNGTHRQIVSYRDGHAIQGGKGLPTLNGTHVPMIVRWPGHVRAGSVSASLFDFVDMYATLADVAGVTVPAGQTDGFSQVPVMTGKADHVRDWIFQHYAPVWIQTPARYIFDARYKLYGDGKFVALDPVAGTETEIASPVGEARRKKAEFQRLLDNMGDGPLDPVRFPMCKDRESVKPGVPAEIAGCPRDPGVIIND